ncbi:MAG: TonB-dependent receptor [Kiritimatiellae bacterium]|nr:TonB-dependent receptor [Kiritimatiellia bacterium]NLD89198.1 TonB-dependent receptor [Lentisphaerota bacterium]HPC19254.1 TonB-dependent receptor [Kiritimatiellia bacterium]
MLRPCPVLAATLLLFPMTAPAADEPARMAPVVVTAPADSLHVAASDSATLLAADPAELPLSVEVLPQALLDQRNVTSVYDSLEQTSGVFTGGKSSFTVSSGKPSIRGFGGNDVLLDGMVLPARMPIFLDAAGLSGIEIFKGPLNSTLGGQSALQGSGGGVNLVGKTPDFNGSFLRLSLGSTFGNGESVRFTADPNQVLSDDLAVRAPLALTYEQPFYLPGGVDGDWTAAASPSVAWKPGENTTLTLAVSWLQTDRAAYQGIPYLKGDFLVPLDTYYGTGDTRDKFTGVAVQFRADHDFSDDLRLSVGGGYARADEERSHWSVSPNPVAADGMTTPQYYDEVLASRTARFSYTDGEHLDENLSAFARLAWTLETGPVVHQLAGGADWLRRETSSESSMGSTGWQSLDHPDLSSPSMSPGIGANESQVDRTGFVLQDFLSWNRWRLLAGTRLDYTDSDSGQTAWSSSPRLGLTFFVLPDQLALFANATLAEGPNFGYSDIHGNELDDPWRSEQFEAGTKLRVMDHLWFTLAAFQITQQDVPELDPLDPSNNSYVLNGENRSRGVETTLSGELTPDWSWWGSYTYCEYEDIDAGIDFERFPAHSASLWTAYRLSGGPLQGLQSGIGLRAKSKYYTTFRGTYLGDDYEIDPSVVFDLAFDYPLPCLSSDRVATRLEFGVKNFLDEEYVESNRHGTENFPGAPRTFWARLSAAF